MENQQYKWLSIYIYHHGDANQLLKQVVHPFIQQWNVPWFFIRYWEGGDHIRLRLKAAESRHAFIIQSLILEESIIRSIKIAEYEPEVDRYGNLKSMPWAERYFERSSVYILKWIMKKEVDQSLTAQAIKLHLTLLFASGWDKKTLIGVCNFFLEGWLPKLYNKTEPKRRQRLFWLNTFEAVFKIAKPQMLKAASQFWQELNAREIDNDFNNYLSETISVMKLYNSNDFKEDKLIQVVSSFMHMNNNRLGISNYEEAYIMYCILACIQFIHENQSYKN